MEVADYRKRAGTGREYPAMFTVFQSGGERENDEEKNPRKMRKTPSSIVGICNMFFEFSFLLFFGFFMTNFPKKKKKRL